MAHNKPIKNNKKNNFDFESLTSYKLWERKKESKLSSEFKQMLTFEELLVHSS